MNSSYSHPEQTIRHSYPLAVKGSGVANAVTLCLKTLPIMLLRFGILAGFTLAALIWFGVIMAIASMVPSAGLGVVFFTAAIGVPFGLFRWLKSYILYMLEMAHIAVLTRLITQGDFGVTESQLAYGKEAVQAHFGQANMLLVLQGLIQGVVNAFTRTLNFLTSFLPIPNIQGPMDILRKILNNATGYISDTMFSYNLARGDENPWRSSKDGLVYYAQNWKPILKTAVYALVVEYAIAGIVFLVFLGPAWGLGALLPRIGGWFVVFGFIMAMNVRTALIRPVCLTMVMLTFHEAVQNQEINLTWDAKLSSATAKFQELTERARTWVSEKTSTPEAKPTPSPLMEVVS